MNKKDLSKILKLIFRKVFIFLYVLFRFCMGVGGLIGFYSVFNVGTALDICLSIFVVIYALIPMFDIKRLLK